MSSAATRTCLPIGYEELLALSEKLGAETLGYAVQLIAWQAHTGAGMSDDVVHRHLGVTRRRWTKAKEIIAEFFILDEDGRWTHPSVRSSETERRAAGQTEPARRSENVEAEPRAKAAIDETAIERVAEIAAEKTAAKMAADQAAVAWGTRSLPLRQTQGLHVPKRRDSLPLPLPEPRAPGAMPVLPVPPEPKTIAQTTFDTGVRLLAASGRSEPAARSLIAKLLQKYDIGYVAAAFDEAWKLRDSVAEPYSWVVRRLGRYPSKEAERTGRTLAKEAAAVGHVRGTTGNSVPRPIATADYLGISAGLGERIRKARDKGFRFDPDA